MKQHVMEEKISVLTEELAIIESCANEIEGNSDHEVIDLRADDIRNHIDIILKEFGIGDIKFGQVMMRMT